MVDIYVKVKAINVFNHATCKICSHEKVLLFRNSTTQNEHLHACYIHLGILWREITYFEKIAMHITMQSTIGPWSGNSNAILCILTVHGTNTRLLDERIWPLVISQEVWLILQIRAKVVSDQQMQFN